ncbi:hypothetical protein PFISCL1PPCAC_3901, partial [Pristionchus fissidentatus]
MISKTNYRCRTYTISAINRFSLLIDFDGEVAAFALPIVSCLAELLASSHLHSTFGAQVDSFLCESGFMCLLQMRRESKHCARSFLNSKTLVLLPRILRLDQREATFTSANFAMILVISTRCFEAAATSVDHILLKGSRFVDLLKMANRSTDRDGIQRTDGALDVRHFLLLSLLPFSLLRLLLINRFRAIEVRSSLLTVASSRFALIFRMQKREFICRLVVAAQINDNLSILLPLLCCSCSMRGCSIDRARRVTAGNGSGRGLKVRCLLTERKDGGRRHL